MGSLTFNESRGKVSGSFTANTNFDVSKTRSGYEMIAPDNGSALGTDDTGRSTDTGVNIMSNFGYDLTPRDVIKGGVSYFDNRSRSTNTGSRRSLTSSGSEVQETSSAFDGRFSSPTVSGTWIHYGDLPDEMLTVYGSASRQAANSTSYFETIVGGTELDRQSNDNKNVNNRTELSADYALPVGDEQLSLGAKTTSDTQASDYSSEASWGGTLDSRKHFVSSQAVSAIYLNYQVEIGDKWTLLGGLRYEHTNLTASQTGTDTSSGKISYGNLTPGLFATYVLSDERKLRFSLTERLQRPTAGDMLPYTDYIDQNRVRVGNPNLKPQKTTTVDAKYDNDHFGNSFGIRLFYAEDQNIISSVSYAIADPLNSGETIVALSQANVGTRRSLGSETTFGKTLNGKVNLSGTFDLIYQDLSEVPNAPFSNAVSVGGNLIAFYTFPKGDSLSLMLTAVPRAITAVGYTMPYAFDSFSYSHALTPKIGLGVTINNLLRMSKIRSVVDTNALKSSFTMAQFAPTVMISLNRSFGGFEQPNKK